MFDLLADTEKYAPYWLLTFLCNLRNGYKVVVKRTELKSGIVSDFKKKLFSVQIIPNVFGLLVLCKSTKLFVDVVLQNLWR